MQAKENRMFWADDVRTIATLSVITLHAAAPMLEEYGKISPTYWWIGNIVDSTLRFCVPLFLMLTGALLLPKPHEIKYFLQRRVARIVYPFLFWTAAYIAYNFWDDPESMNESVVAHQLKYGAAQHLWYIYMIIGIYLILPIISKWVINSTKKEIGYYAIVWGIVVVINLPGIREAKPNIDLTYFTGFLGYLIVGYLLSTSRANRKNKLIAISLLLIGSLITIMGTYWVTADQNNFNDSFYEYSAPNVIIASMGMFLLIRHSNPHKHLFGKFSKVVSKYSFGIYLAHAMVMMFLSDYLHIDDTLVHPIVGIVTTTIITLFASLSIAYLLGKIPKVGKYIAG